MNCGIHSAEAMDGGTVAELLSDARQRLTAAGIPPDEAQIEARLLMQHASGLRAERILAAPDARLAPDALATFAESVRRRVVRVPLAYLVGTAPFYGRTFRMPYQVLVPRPETEMLVEYAVATAEASAMSAPRICDLGSGSGVLAVTLALEIPDAEVVALDISPHAATTTASNAALHGVSERVTSVFGDMTDPDLAYDLGRFDIIVSNPPYIPDSRFDGELEPEVSLWEPRDALSGGHDGLRTIEPLIGNLPELLAAPGPSAAYVEIDHTQAATVFELAGEAAPDAEVAIVRDAAGLERMLAVVRE